ncbi:uncharacterized protein G2W53_022066 [Senna tora]|uniref:Uncharacterized protein n=1 Tax=Senna tora TaxID=362788 RepID=A0A834TM25_9FABA|nr:uncharacterized protein G2W53_022066 [Senna tora]
MSTRIFLGMKLKRNLAHVGTHKREISRKKALLLYLLMTNQPVKMEVIIYKSLCKVAYNGRAGCALIFPHMISDFYFNTGVIEDDTDAMFKPKQQLDYKRVGKGRVDPDDPCTSEAQAHPTAEASAQPRVRGRELICFWWHGYFGSSIVAWVLLYYECVAAKF